MGDPLIGSRHSDPLELKTAQIGRAPTSNDIRRRAETAWDRNGTSRWAGGTCCTGAGTGIHNGWVATLNVGSLAWQNVRHGSIHPTKMNWRPYQTLSNDPGPAV